MAKTDKLESGFTDVSSEAEQAAKDAEAPLKVDKDGNPQARTSEAANAVAEEMAKRSAAASNGGGAFPEEVLRRRFMGSTPMERVVGEYTSHETDA